MGTLLTQSHFNMSSEHSFASLSKTSAKKFKSLGGKSKSSSQQHRANSLKKNKLFRRIEADIKERDRRRVPGRPEDYVDPNRGISVNLGPSDIRTSMLKSRTFLSKTYVFMQEEQQGYKVLVEQATHEMHKGAFDRALCYLNKAIRVRGKRLLSTYSQCMKITSNMAYLRAK